ncbi:PRD domain-containing protein [Tetragenococcus koreensis]|uniref:PRD domain-containing protein n=1 Tax=Tetragenococcus koreensis TaxID=290335 RepID=UPI00221FE25E|nr:PRD domain-containing protein [Tetragenococcus koreensis]
MNNNVAWIIDDHNERVIAIGKGLSFGKQAGDNVTLAEIERIFTDDKKVDEISASMRQALENISADTFLLTEEISDQAAALLSIDKFDDNHFLALADHLNYAMKRSDTDTIDYPENLRWEVKKLYPKEHDAAVDALYLIEKKTGVRLPESEQTFLTYHFVNAQYDSDINIQTKKLTELVNRAVEIIQYHYQTLLNQNSVNYIRFVTHLRYFILRQINHENDKIPKIDEQLIEVVKKNYRKAYQAAEKVGKMIETTQNCEVNTDELFYLTLHIDRVTQRQN